MSDILERDFTILESGAQKIDTFMIKTGETTKPDICLSDTSLTEDGVVCYI